MSLQDHAAALAASLEKAQLVPGSAASLIPAHFTPSTKLTISFGPRAVEVGNFFRAGECKIAPSVSFAPEADASSSASYTLILTDPDAPTPDDPKFAFWRHWVLSGLQPLSGDSGEVALTKGPVTDYLGPGPKDDSKPHRYLFLLYREPEGLVLKKEDAGGEEFVQRRSFKPAEFAEKFGLKLVSVNWMTCAGDGWTE
ncbi:putative Phosphatidylethanolamine-binding protein [Seiridium unicorne]|uniref:Phosphatidylethanolamine-binding protein n=1 Tax=Seiridium unicorne TaxID=138068 RepID=A0ABR2VA34_9PEZI